MKLDPTVTTRVKSFEAAVETDRKAFDKCERAQAEVQTRYDAAAKATADADAAANANPSDEKAHTRHGVLARQQALVGRELANAQAATATARAQLAASEQQLTGARSEFARAKSIAEKNTVIVAFHTAVKEHGARVFEIWQELNGHHAAVEAAFADAQTARAELAALGEASPAIEPRARFAGLVEAFVDADPSRAISLYEHRALLVEPVSRPLAQLVTPFKFLVDWGKPRANVTSAAVAHYRALITDWFGDRSLEARLEAESQAESTARWEQAQREQREAKARAAREAEPKVKWATEEDMLARLDKQRARDGAGG